MVSSFTAKERIDFRQLKKRPTTVYVILPGDYLRSHKVWLRLVLVSALRALFQPGGTRVMILIDELAALGHLGALEDAFGLVGGYSVQIMGILQDLNQLQRLYEKSWGSFIANAGVTQFFAPNEMTTAEWMERRGGPTTIWAPSVGQSSGTTADRESKNWNQVRVPRFRAHELYDLPPGVGLSWFNGLADTVMFKAPNYWELRCGARALPNPFKPR
jgi:type IV secretion system protein VirD4